MYILKRFASKLSRSKYVKKDEILHKTKTNILSMKYTTMNRCLFSGGELKNVTDYLDRIKSLYWPDWELLCKRVK